MQGEQGVTHPLKRVIGSIFYKALEYAIMPIRAAVASIVRTDTMRWRKVAKQKPSWDERNRLIAGLIPENSSVVDLGSGAMTLRQYLPKDCHYQPCDVVPCSEKVLFCDFNSGIYPALSRKYDFVVCSGVLEYVRDPATFLSKISDFGTKILLSYNPLVPNETKYSRLGRGWVNHLSQKELEELFVRSGLTYRVVLKRERSETTYELSRGQGNTAKC